MNKIKLLPKDLINKIAAGEVVERPASIVKELMENSIDAGASEIILTLENSGLDSISVSDNGAGMDKEDASRAVLQHATSKISKEEDLYHINTLGFRGEALASIGSISDLYIHTYDGRTEPVLVEIRDGEKTVKAGPGRTQGTTIKASKIFSLVPARRKFLKSEATEYRYILDTFINLALTAKQIRFKLIKNGKVQLDLLATESILNRILDLNPGISNQDLIELNFEEPGYELKGYVIRPGISSPSNPKQYLFLNYRFIHSPLVNKAIKEGYATSIMSSSNPSYFIFLKLDTDKFDINVHPRKLEVRFENPTKIFSIVKNTVAFHLEKGMQTEFRERFKESKNIENTYRPIGKGRAAQEFLDFEAKDKKDVNASIEFTKNILTDIKQVREVVIDIDRESKYIYTSMQVFNTYIITEKDDNIIFIDQHAADERVNFEKISLEIEKEEKLKGQSLLLPEHIILSVNDIAMIRANLELFKKLGFELNNIKKEAVDIVSIPLILQNGKIRETFIEILKEIGTDSSGFSSTWRKIKDKIIATLACHSSIRGGQRLSNIEINKLIADLDDCKLPNSCPHGRPIVFQISKNELEKKLKRRA